MVSHTTGQKVRRVEILAEQMGLACESNYLEGEAEDSFPRHLAGLLIDLRTSLSLPKEWQEFLLRREIDNPPSERLLLVISDRACRVLSRQFLFSGLPPKTLQGIIEEFELSREDIHPAYRHHFQQLVEGN